MFRSGLHFLGCQSYQAVRTCVQCLPQGVYRPRNAQASPLYRLVEDHFDKLERVWDGRYEREYGFWRPVVRHVVEQFLDCGDFMMRRLPTLTRPAEPVLASELSRPPL